MPKKLNFNEIKYYIEISSKSGCILLSESYTRSIDKLMIKCKCGEVFYTSFKEFSRTVNPKQQCNKCGYDTTRSKQQLDFKTVKYEIEKKSFLLLSPPTDYLNAKSKLTVKCVNNHITERSYDNISSNFGCPKCVGKHKTNKEFSDEIDKLYKGEFTVLGEYIKASKKLSIVHNKCNKVFNVTPNSLLRKGGCPHCKGKRISNSLTKTHEDFVKSVRSKTNGEYIVISKYKNSKEKVDLLHTKCGKTFEIEAASFISKPRCVNCKKVSKGQEIIKTLLSKLNIEFFEESSIVINENSYRLRFDFLIGDSLSIEFDGKQHFRPVDFAGKGILWAQENLKRTQYLDKLKNEYCVNNKINLIRIPYWDIDIIEYIIKQVLSYFNIANQKSNEEAVHKYLVNHPDWSYEEYIKQAK